MWLLFATEGHEDGQGQVSHLSPGLCPRAMMHADLHFLHCYLMSGDIWSRAAAEGLVWISGPDAIAVCVEVCGPRHSGSP